MLVSMMLSILKPLFTTSCEFSQGHIGHYQTLSDKGTTKIHR